MQQSGTAACDMRDQLLKLVFAKKITPKQITDRLTKTDLPDFLRGQIIAMCQFNEMKRCTCFVEQAMYQAVCNHIVRELMDSERQGQ